MEGVEWCRGEQAWGQGSCGARAAGVVLCDSVARRENGSSDARDLRREVASSSPRAAVSLAPLPPRAMGTV